MSKVALGLGSNVGDRLGNIRKAVALVGERVGRILSVSDVYETPPWGVTGQTRFLNACLTVETEVVPYDLLSELKEIEHVLGRVDRERWGPREIDIDVLLYDDLHFESDYLTIPHPFLHERSFVLLPLVTIAPQWRHPCKDTTVEEMAQSADSTGIIRITGI